MSIGMGIEREHKDLADVKYQIKKTRGAGKKALYQTLNQGLTQKKCQIMSAKSTGTDSYQKLCARCRMKA